MLQKQHAHFQGSLGRWTRGKEVWEAVIFTSQEASQNCGPHGGQMQRQSLLSHPRLEKHKPLTPSWSTVLGSMGTAHTLAGSRGIDMGWCKSQGMWPHWATPRDEASLGRPRRGYPPGFMCTGFVLKKNPSVLAEVSQQNQLDSEIWWGSSQLRVSHFVRIWQSEAPDNHNNKL